MNALTINNDNPYTMHTWPKQEINLDKSILQDTLIALGREIGLSHATEILEDMRTDNYKKLIHVGLQIIKNRYTTLHAKTQTSGPIVSKTPKSNSDSILIQCQAKNTVSGKVGHRCSWRTSDASGFCHRHKALRTS
jgi:hypothetical protein